MKILEVENIGKGNGIKVRAILGQPEFKQLTGSLANLCVFATDLISVKTSYTKTGARHRAAKYLLLPASIRRKLGLQEYNFENLVCGHVEYRDKVFIVYGVTKKFGAV